MSASNFRADLVAVMICIQARVATFLWGGPGIGKTAVIEAIADGIHEDLWTVILSIREPSDQGGLPIITEDGVKMHPPLWAKQLCEKGKGIVFFDEFNTAPPTTQSSALRVVHGGYAGDLKLPKETSFIAAGNPPNVSSGGFDLTSAIANRWAHFDWPVDANRWAEGMISGWPSVQVVRVHDKWMDGLAVKRSLVASFIRRKTNLLYALPENAADQGRAWPSPRSWDRVATLLAAASSVGYGPKSEVGQLLIQSSVGQACAIEFNSWFSSLDLRDPEEYMTNPTTTPLPERQDQVMATLDGVVSVAVDRGKSDDEKRKRYVAAWKVIARVVRAGNPDISIPACRILSNSSNVPKGMTHKDLPDEVLEINPILHKAGLLKEKAA